MLYDTNVMLFPPVLTVSHLNFHEIIREIMIILLNKIVKLRLSKIDFYFRTVRR